MESFRSSLVVRASTTRSHRLPKTGEIFHFAAPFVLLPSSSFLLVASGGVEVYSTSPMSLMKTLSYQHPVTAMCFVGGYLVLLNESALSIHRDKQFGFYEGEFKECKLMKINIKGDEYIGIQGVKEMSVYDINFIKQSVYSAQCSYSDVDILLLGEGNTLRIHVRGCEKKNVLFPGRISSVCCDALFTAVFAASEDGNIYVFSLTGEEMRVFEYHTEPVKNLCVSFCGSYLYSSDTHLLCVWDIQRGVVIGLTEYENEIMDIKLFLHGERAKKDVPDIL